MITLRVLDSDDPAIADFGRLQREVYLESDQLIPAEYIPRMLEQVGSERQNFLLVAQTDGVVVGGTFFHYLAAPHSAFSSFLGVASRARGRGIARQLHTKRFEILDATARRPVPGLFLDVTAPQRLPPEALEAERRFGFDPAHRRHVFHALGFRRVDVRYEQPVGGPGGGPLTTLDLLFCPREAADQVPTTLVLETLRAYWTPWLGGARAAREVERLAARAGGEALPLRDA